jgi:hypothetical protein
MKPLTEDEKLALIEKHIRHNLTLGFYCSLFNLIDDVEAAHGIKEPDEA